MPDCMSDSVLLQIEVSAYLLLVSVQYTVGASFINLAQNASLQQHRERSLSLTR